MTASDAGFAAPRRRDAIISLFFFRFRRFSRRFRFSPLIIAFFEHIYFADIFFRPHYCPPASEAIFGFHFIRHIFRRFACPPAFRLIRPGLTSNNQRRLFIFVSVTFRYLFFRLLHRDTLPALDG